MAIAVPESTEIRTVPFELTPKRTSGDRNAMVWTVLTELGDEMVDAFDAYCRSRLAGLSLVSAQPPARSSDNPTDRSCATSAMARSCTVHRVSGAKPGTESRCSPS